MGAKGIKLGSWDKHSLSYKINCKTPRERNELFFQVAIHLNLILLWSDALINSFKYTGVVVYSKPGPLF